MTPADLKSARKALGLSVRELAGHLRMGANGADTIRRWERGNGSIPGPVEVAIEYMTVEYSSWKLQLAAKHVAVAFRNRPHEDGA